MTISMLLLAAVLGLVAGFRVWRRQLFASTSGRAVTALIASDCLITLVSPNEVTLGVDRVSGVPNLVLLLQCLLCLSSVGAVVLALPGTVQNVGGLRRHFSLTAVAAATMVIAFGLTPVHQVDVSNYWADLVIPLRTGPGSLPALCFWLAYASAMAHGLALALPDLRRHQRSAPTGRARFALRLLLGAGACTSLYLFFGSLVVLLRAMDWPGGPLNGADLALRSATTAIGPLLLAGLVCINVPIERAAEVVREHYYLHRLRPLWRDMTEAAPALEVPGQRGVHRSLTDVRLRLYRTVIEIRDGYVAIAPWYCDASPLVARHAGVSEQDPVVVATCWELARRAALRGAPHADSVAAPPGGAATLGREIALLREIARHRLRAHGLADELAARLAKR
ncbi:hypothetical protein SAMN05892883_4389 [Jatrophihabitans sp. GAS493]|uniref:MAB_1171c family putative transporter n=1 Tax=Jatrophihabitans sp. GAS493 TaxID=1907575 RepID=UPI000BB81150|nr:MAB_1171c family putative transporter [Jatrophihabitans sp. GAS493]SOD75183.1 hypothetical protein SAMN05892883_4389 [Jatrophihabitans sp. GAS493]